MRADRLELVAKTLEGVPDEKFNMATWAREDSSCGTVGCAVGHYVMAYPDQGLKLLWIDGLSELVFTDDSCNEGGWEAVTEHFDLDEYDAYDLFDGDMYDQPVTRQAVIDKIRTFIASNGETR